MRRHFIIRGRVQGVFFRATTQDVARRVGARVRVWNRDDGAVECIAEGTEEQLAMIEAFLHEGPPHARVGSVERVEE